MSEAFLDSHVAIWLAAGSPRLAPVLHSRFRAGSCVVSSISIAEFAIKAIAGKITLPKNPVESFERVGITIAAFDAAAGDNVARFTSLQNHDPFDRLILAHAASRPATTFYTADARLLELGLDWIVDARA